MSHALLTEALTLDYIGANTTIPVPRVHRVFKNSRRYLNIVMDYLCDYITQLCQLTPPRPGAVEAVDGSPCKDFRVRPDSFGPFDAVAEFQAFLGRD
ncbi:hypothetical protein C8J57DRAFT_1502131 [Mycena rebaudengoi]|nr:hypothetical protein C8J57DRAFT_1502131 [Mycena rebaudengoi]